MRIIAILVVGIVAFYVVKYFTATKPTDSGAPMVAVTVPTMDPKMITGEKLFNDNCAACHGAAASGRDGIGPPLIHKIYEPSHHGDAAFLLAAKRGVRAHHWPFGNMPVVENVNETDVQRIVDYVRFIQRANGIN